MQTFHIIETERLNLILITPDIIRSLMQASSKQEVLKLFGCNDQYYQRLQNMVDKGMETDRISMRIFLLQCKATLDTIGECGFHTWNATHRRSEVFYFLNNDEHKRKGYMKEALQAVLKHGFEDMKLHRIQGLIAEVNTPSKRLLEYYGFQKEGIMREDYVVDGVSEDSTCYSLLKWEWDSKTLENA